MRTQMEERRHDGLWSSGTWLIVALALLIEGCGGDGGNQSVTVTPPATYTVTIKRDMSGVPHVYANDAYGVFYGYGYSLAEDRLFQLEMARRSFNGSVAEVLGPGTNNANVNFDISVRSNFEPNSIRDQITALSQADRDIFQGYADGFNARIDEVLAAPTTLLPKQFTDFGFQPVHWTPFDVVMVWVGSMANRFSDSNSEISNLALLNNLVSLKGGAVGKQIFNQIRWTNDPLAPSTVPLEDSVNPQVAAAAPKKTRKAGNGISLASSPDHKRLAKQLARLAPISSEAAAADRQVQIARYGSASPDLAPKASNLWITGPKKTADGSTVLINGPQFGWFNPAYTFAVGLHGGGFDVVGNTPFGYPIIFFGTNGKIAWGSTAGPLDVVDMYQEKLNSGNSHQYLYNGTYLDMGKRTDVINVKGSAQVTVDVYSTVHGLVTSFDAANNVAYAKKRSWAGLEVQSLMAWINSMKAQTWEQFLDQAALMATTVNWYYADTSGNIGYVSPGRLPLRPATQDFRLPADGTGGMEWQGFTPPSANPKVLNPKQGFITNWNNKPSPGTDSTDSTFWSPADRVNELITQFAAKDKFTADELWAFNQWTSSVDVNARYFRPYIADAVSGLPATSPVKQAGLLVAAWDGLQLDPTNTGFYNNPALTIMQSWLSAMLTRTLQADIPPANLASFTSTGYPSPTNPPSGSISTSAGTRIVYNALLGPSAGVPQAFDFFHGADKYQVIRDAMNDAVTQLTVQYGSDMSKWLSPVATLRFRSTNFTGTPQANADEQPSFAPFQNKGTSMNKFILGASGVSMCDVTPPGQSGFVAPGGAKSPHYQDQLDLYSSFGCKPEWTKAADVDAHVESTKNLSYTH